MKRIFLTLLMLATFTALASAQELETVPAETVAAERKINNKIPDTSPVKVTAIRNLQGDEWWKDFELEVKNTGDKPIYYFSFLFYFSEVFPPGASYGNIEISLQSYGRRELFDLKTLPTPEDIPLKPGESCVLKIPEEYGWAMKRQYARKDVTPESLNKLGLMFRQLNYGDGTGLGTTGALPFGKLR